MAKRKEFDPHAHSGAAVHSLPGCCSASVIEGLYSLSPKRLAEAEAIARHWRQHCVLATVNTNQMQVGVGDILTRAGWKEVHQFFSKWYGGGRVHIFAKNLVDSEQEAPPKFVRAAEDTDESLDAFVRIMEAV